MSQYQFGFDKWDVTEETPSLNNNNPNEEIYKNSTSVIEIDPPSQTTLIHAGSSKSTNPSNNPTSDDQFETLHIEMEDTENELVEYSEISINSSGNVQPNTTVINSSENQLNGSKKLPIILSGKYFKLNSSDEKSYHATCSICKKTYRGLKNVSSNFTSHLKVCFISLWCLFLLICVFKFNYYYQSHPESWKSYLEEKGDKCKSRKKTGNMMIESEMTQKKFDDALVRFIIKDLQPLCRVETPAFRQLLLSK